MDLVRGILESTRMAGRLYRAYVHFEGQILYAVVGLLHDYISDYFATRAI